MKLFSLFLLLLLLFNFRPFAQNYELAKPNHSYYFKLDDPGFQWSQPQWSPIKVLYFDSSGYSVNHKYNSFYSWKDSLSSCIFENGPSWTGGVLIDLANDKFAFLNSEKDSIYFITSAVVNSSWRFMNIVGNGYVDAHVDSLTYMQAGSIQDSVKCISLTAYDSIGNIDSNNPMNNFNIQLSRSNGFFIVPVFRELPTQVYSMRRIDSIPIISEGTLYDFNVGDKFEYSNVCLDAWGQWQSLNDNLVEIQSKYFSPGLDSVYYCRKSTFRYYSQNFNPPPAFITSGFNIEYDTVKYATSAIPTFSEFPEQNIYHFDTLSLPHSTLLYNYTLMTDSNYYHGRPSYSWKGGFIYNLDGIDSCFHWPSSAFSYNTRIVSTGLGEVYHSEESPDPSANDCYNSLFYYQKGNETYGNFVDLTSGVTEITNTVDISIFPSPVTSLCYVESNSVERIEFRLTDTNGKLLLKEFFIGKTSIYMERLISGIYFLKFISQSGTLVKKIIKQ